MSERLWVITTFFNATGHVWRLRNLRAVRRHLKVPLLVVELAQPGENHLCADDADRVVMLSGDPQIWQKERLLNIAVQHLPPEAEYVAWLDCDILFDRHEWIEEAVALLGSGKQFVQLFDRLARLPKLDPQALHDIDALRAATPLIEKPAFASALHGGSYFVEQREPRQRDSGSGADGNKAYGFVHGIGWATHRDLLQNVGLYDACVIGGGPSAMALASIGRPDMLIEKRPMSDAHQQHYLAWASAFTDNRVDDVGFVPGTAFHLWHGPHENRRYRERHLKLKELAFNPQDDLELSENGAWRWAPNATALQTAVIEYFSGRRED